MVSAESKIAQIGEIHFGGKVGRQISKYAKENQRLAHDLAAELDVASGEALAAMRRLRRDPRLRRIDVLVKAILVARHLRRARDLCQGISAEMVRFNAAYRREFLEIEEEMRRRGRRADGEVTL
ncbi:hypothetical protein Acsp04_58880 [Actinomadura sp. NBRC 104425]|uniref:hypothetical protein n=1 Tax=Actinomadura sp. NBRC 104425 TaxID=3032204 RepID=UPI0024A4C95C|nr:hypothetical protein [Actinomadura sp. NBRC 104425]GLZ15653.1 hypothetical protein Acsp04_58880 [Actinomadura sp. NBRC 104425]